MAGFKETMDNVKDQAADFLAQQSMTRKLVAGVVLLCALAALVVILLYTREPVQKEVLFAQLDVEQAQMVKEELLNLGESHFDLEENKMGWTVKAPAESVQAYRLAIVPKLQGRGDEKGWALFDTQHFGTTSEEHKVRLYRALKQELQRTISAMEMVKAAKVDLAIPEPELFVREKTPPKASVLLELLPGATMDKAQVDTIRALIAGAVDEMKPENVTVADTLGNELSKVEEIVVTEEDRVKEELDNRERIINIHNRLRNRTEGYLEDKILDALTPVFGVGHVRAKVNVHYDHTIKEETAVEYLDPVPVSEAYVKRAKGDEGKIAIGVTGATQHVDNVKDMTPEELEKLEFVEEQIKNNNVGRKESRVIYSPYSIQRVTAAVVVDNKPTVETDEEGNQQMVRKPLTNTEVSDLEETVQGIINFNKKRGDGVSDMVKVTNISFFPSIEPEKIDTTEGDKKRQIRMWIQYGLIALSVLLILIFVVRPLMNILAPKPTPEDMGLLDAQEEVGALPSDEMAKLQAARERAGLAAPEGGALPEPEAKDILTARSDELDDEIMNLVKENPKKVGMVFRAWLET